MSTEDMQQLPGSDADTSRRPIKERLRAWTEDRSQQAGEPWRTAGAAFLLAQLLAREGDVETATEFGQLSVDLLTTVDYGRYASKGGSPLGVPQYPDLSWLEGKPLHLWFPTDFTDMTAAEWLWDSYKIGTSSTMAALRIRDRYKIRPSLAPTVGDEQEQEDVRYLTAKDPATDHALADTPSTMPLERERPVPGEAVPGDNIATLSEGRDQREQGARALIPAVDWRPGEDFSPGSIAGAFGNRPPETVDHPRDGHGFAWTLPTGVGEATRFELFPERRVAKLRAVDTVDEPQRREYVVDRLAVQRSDAGESVVIFSARDRRASLLRVYPSGEFDEHFRVLPSDAEGLPWQGTIWGGAAPQSHPVPEETNTPRELTAVEAAEELGISRPAVSRLVKNGQLRARRVANRKLLIDAADVAAYAQSASGRRKRKEPPVASGLVER